MNKRSYFIKYIISAILNNCFTLIKRAKKTQKHSYQYVIACKELRNNTGEKILIITDNKKNKLIRASIKELVANSKVIEHFSPRDAFDIGMTYAENQFVKEKSLLDMLKKKTDKFIDF